VPGPGKSGELKKRKEKGIGGDLSESPLRNLHLFNGGTNVARWRF
jgi:hypothetical protein